MLQWGHLMIEGLELTMLKLCECNEGIYLAALERAHCRQIFEDNEYDFQNAAEPMLFGLSHEDADHWFEEIQRLLKEQVNIRLGIFLADGTVLGDVALQGIDAQHRTASVGIGFSKLAYRGRGHGTQALRIMLGYGFDHLGLERITASTLEGNVPCQRMLQKAGFTLEGRARRAVYFRGKRWDELHYALLLDEWKDGK